MATIPESELLEELRSLAGKLYRHPKTRDMTEFGAYSPHTYRNRFGSWEAALEAAGIADLTAPALPDAELLDALHEVQEVTETDSPPTQNAVKTHGPYSPVLYLDRFESWLAALRTAGFDTHTRTDPEQMTASPAELKTALEQVATMIHRTPTADEMDQYGDYRSTLYQAHFGSWDDAVDAVGLAAPSESRQTQYSDPDLREHLRAVAADLGRPPTVDEMNAMEGPSALTYQYRFGSWGTALKEAGLDPSTVPSQGLSDEELVADLQALADELDTTPTQRDMRERGSHSPTTYARRFGSWNDALRAANLTPNLTRRDHDTSGSPRL